MSTHGLTGLTVTHIPGIKGEDLTRLSWRGWHVDLGGQRVTVPSQPIAGKNTADLDLSLSTGYRMLGIATAPRSSPLPRVRDRLPDDTITHIVETLRSAQRIADAACRRGAFDVYDCTSRAWQDAGMSVPYAWLMRSLRAALPPGRETSPSTTAGPAQPPSTTSTPRRSAAGVARTRRPPPCRRTSPRKGVAVTTLDPPLGPCPAWCEKPAHHDWEDEWLNGLVRVHVWARPVTKPDPIRGDEIRIEEAEQHTEDGVMRRRTIVVDVEAPTEWDLDTAVKAHDLLGVAITLAATEGADAP